MNYIQTEIDGVWIIEPKIFFDPRGYFMEAFKQQEFDATIGFNPQLTLNDGVLVQSYMAVYDTNFS